MGQGHAKAAKPVDAEADSGSAVDPPAAAILDREEEEEYEDPEVEPIFGSPLEKTHAFPLPSEGEVQSAKRISIGEVKTPSPELQPRQTEHRDESTVKMVPFVFRWNYGGNEVYLSGDFNNWETNIPLSKSQGDFTGIVELPEGDYQYKFIVDGLWLHDPDEEAVDNNLGSKNNVLTVTPKDIQAYDSQDFLRTTSDGGESSSPAGSYTQDIPSYKGATVGLPPHLPSVLQNTILNQELPLKDDPTFLPEPNSVILNHLYALSVKDHVLVLAATHRYKEKYVTTLIYKPV